MFDVLCIGNALIDAFLTISDASKHLRVDDANGELCIKKGEKIPLDNVNFELGGNACNVSVGLKRLGLKTSLIVEFGNDAFAHKIKGELEGEGVNITYSVTTPTMTSFGVGINFRKERSLFVWHVEREHDFKLEGIQTKWVYLSSIGKNWRHVYRSIPSYIKSTGYNLAFNPGTRQIDAGIDVISPVLSVTNILFVNKEEAVRIIYGKDRILSGNNREQVKKLAIKLKDMGPKIVVITDGQYGAYVLSYENEFDHQTIIPVPVIEKTGAGDSFSSAFLAAILNGHDIKDALAWGACNSSSVIGKVGAQPGLLNKEQIIKRVISYKL